MDYAYLAQQDTKDEKQKTINNLLERLKTVTDTINAMYKKLAAYEDTGYSPLEIKSIEGEWIAMRKVVDSYRAAVGKVEQLPRLY